VPRYPDDDLVPPLKVMRKRLNGVYRADSGFSGPTRRYVLLVALLVGLASVPTLAAITAGSNELADGKTDTLDIPVLPPASPGPVVGTSPEPTPSSSSGVGDVPQSDQPPSVRGGSDGGEAAVRAGRLVGEAGKRKPRAPARSPAPSPARSKKPASDPSMIAFPPLPGMRTLPGLPPIGGRTAEPGVLPSLPSDSDTPADPTPAPDRNSQDSDPDKSDSSDWDDAPDPHPKTPAWATRPYCHERGKCGTHHQRPDKSRKRPCEESSRHRSPDRSEHSRRSTVTERPRNVRPASILERSHAYPTAPAGHNRRHISEGRGDENQNAYRGAHRASQHHADEQTAAQRRSSRVGRHHAENSEDLSGRW
jgi:hypothetical protein